MFDHDRMIIVFSMQGDLNGHKGLVPSNFLQAFLEDLPAEQVSTQPAPEPKRESQVWQRLSGTYGHLQNSRWTCLPVSTSKTI